MKIDPCTLYFCVITSKIWTAAMFEIVDSRNIVTCAVRRHVCGLSLGFILTLPPPNQT
jgi:hypothetical protein